MKESCLFFFLLFAFLFPPYISFSSITLLHPFFPYCYFCFFLPSFAFLLPFLHSSLPLSYLLYLLSLLLLSLLPCLSFNQVVRMEKGVQDGETMQQGKFLKRLWKRKLKTDVGTHPLPWLVPGTANRENTILVPSSICIGLIQTDTRERIQKAWQGKPGALGVLLCHGLACHCISGVCCLFPLELKLSCIWVVTSLSIQILPNVFFIECCLFELQVVHCSISLLQQNKNWQKGVNQTETSFHPYFLKAHQSLKWNFVLLSGKIMCYKFYHNSNIKKNLQDMKVQICVWIDDRWIAK